MECDTMKTTVAISEQTHKELSILKIKEGYKSIDELIKELIIEYKKNKLLEISKEFRKRMDERGLKPEDLIE